MKVACVLLFLVGAAVAADLCTLEFSPKCGTDKKVYVNKCMMEKAGTSESDTFENCRGNNFICPAACTKELRPVCAGNGKIYPNKCVMQHENCGVLMMEMPMEDCQTY